LNRKFRITSTNDFKRVRREGKSYAHPLVVVIVAPGSCENSRVGIITGKSIGNAVHRNKVKRRLRALLSGMIENIRLNKDLVVIARTPINDASFVEIQLALKKSLIRAGLLE
jgi:ribonuclease P protein component